MDQAARYSVGERTKIVETYLATKSVVQTQRQFRRDFPDGNVLTGFTIQRPLHKFRELEDQLDFLDFISFSDK